MTKEQWDQYQLALPLKDRHLIKVSSATLASLKAWILKACAKVPSCRKEYLSGEIGKLQKGVGQR